MLTPGRRHTSKSWSWFCLLIVMVIACCPQKAFSGSKTLRAAIETTDIRTLMPGLVTTTPDMFVSDMVYNGLLRFKPGDISVLEPDLAESYSVSPDGMELTFKLRKGVMSHPFKGHPKGVEITAEDVLFTINMNKDNQKNISAVAFQNFDASAPDPYTVVVRLKERVPAPERNFANFRSGWIIPKKAYETVGERRFKTSPVGTGPFYVSEYHPGQKIVLNAHKSYFRGTPKLGRVEVLFMPEINSREFALINGSVDVVDGKKQQSWIDKMKTVENATVDVFGPGELAFLNFNVSCAPFDNRKVREAMSLATDINALRIFKGEDIAQSISGVITPAIPGGLQDEEAKQAGVAHVYDMEKAKALLSEAGYPNGFTIKVVSSERTPFRHILENIQAQWRKVGVDMQLEVVDHATFHSRVRQNTSPVIMYISQRPDADTWLSQFFHSDAIVVHGKSPVTNFSNCKAIDDLIESARAEVDPAKQIAMWKKAQIEILKNYYVVPMYLQMQVWAHNKNVSYGYPLSSSFTTAPNINELTTKN